MNEIHDTVYANGPKKLTLKQLKILIDNESKSDEFKGKLRKMISDILSSQRVIEKDIFKSRFIKKKKDRKQQLLATKIYRLRCRNKILSARLQSR